MANYTLESFKIEYAQFGDPGSPIEIRASGRYSSEPVRSTIDGFRDVLLRAGWSFVNPYSDLRLGSGTLVEHRITDGAIDLIVAVNEEFNRGRQYLLVKRVEGPLVPPTLYEAQPNGSEGDNKIFRVVVESGIDRDWLPGSEVLQVRGITAEGSLFVPAFQDYSMFFPGMGFSDSNGLNTGLHFCVPTVEDPCNVSCGVYSAPAPYAAGGAPGICGFIAFLYICIGSDWRVDEQKSGPSPLLGTFQEITLAAETGRHRITGDPLSGVNDNSGTQGNKPRVYFNSSVSPYYGGQPTTDVVGGGWLMESYPTPNGTKITVAITENHSRHISFKFLGRGGAFAKWSQVAVHSCPIPGTADKQFWNERIFNAPEYILHGGPGGAGDVTSLYSIVANPYQFAIIDLANDDVSGGFDGGNSLLVCCPYVDTSRFNLNPVVVIGPGMLMANTYWIGFSVSVALEGNFVNYNTNIFSAAGVTGRIYPFNEAFRNSNLRSIVSNSYLMAARDGLHESEIVGKVWDALTISEALPKGSRFSIDNHQFEVISSQEHGVVSSLALAV